MAGVLNKTARQFNLKAKDPKKGGYVVVRLAPGLNDVPDELWACFKGDPFVNKRIKDGEIVHGKEVTEKVEEDGPDTELKSKRTAPVGNKKKQAAPKDPTPPLVE